MDDPFITYRMADGSAVNGEFAFVTNEEYFDDLDEPAEVIKEVWSLVSTETLTFGLPPVEDDEGPA